MNLHRGVLLLAFLISSVASKNAIRRKRNAKTDAGDNVGKAKNKKDFYEESEELFSAPTESPSAALTYSTRKTYRGVSFELNARRIDKTLINFLWSNGPIINFLDLRFSNIDDDKVMRFAPTLQRMDNLN